MDKRTVKLVMVIAMLLVVCLYFVGGTYARYVSEFSGSADVNVAKWAVKLAGDASAQEKEFTLTLNNIEENNDVVNGKIAPSVSLTGNIEVDLSGTEVSVDILTKIDEEEIKNAINEALDAKGSITNNDIAVTVSAKGSGQLTSVNSASALDEAIKVSLPNTESGFKETDKVTLTVKVTWDNADDQHNADHTLMGENAEQLQKLSIPVTLHVYQHIEADPYAIS